jgi:hypothetical protein
MDLVPRLQLQSLEVNPKSPNIPISGAKCASEYSQAVDEDMQAIASKGTD